MRNLYADTPPSSVGVRCLHRKAKTRRKGLCPKCYQKYLALVNPDTVVRMKEARQRTWQKNRDKRRLELRQRYADQKTWVRRNKYYKTTYGITIWQFNQMLRDQNGGCYICGRDTGLLHVDHCHKTQRVRGLLCWRCNKTLGVMQDDVSLLGKAIEYLSRDFDGRKIPGRVTPEEREGFIAECKELFDELSRGGTSQCQQHKDMTHP